MKTPNNHYLDLGGKFYHSQNSVILIASSILRSCEPLFEAAVEQKKALIFEFDENDFVYLRGLFLGVTQETVLVREFLDGIINQRLKLAYGISAVFREVGSNIFRCRVVQEYPVYE